MCRGDGLHVAKSLAHDHRTALDAAIARVKRQVLDEKETPPRAGPGTR